MLLEPIKITLYNQENEPEHEYVQPVITFEMLLAATQLAEAMKSAEEPQAKRRWWWQKPITRESAQIDALLSLVTAFFNNQFTVAELRRGADVGEVMAVFQAILARAGSIMQANPTTPLPQKRQR